MRERGARKVPQIQEGDSQTSRESEDRALRALAELSSDWFWEQDADFRFTRIFGKATSLFKRKPTDFIGQRRWDMPIVWLTPTQCAEHIATCERHEAFRNLEYFLPGEDGAPQFYSISGTPIFDDAGQFSGYIGIGRNVTDLRLAEVKVRRSERQLSQIVDGSPIPTFVIDIEHRITHWNRACAILTGLDAPVMLGRQDVWRAFYDQPRPCLADLVVSGIEGEASSRLYPQLAPSSLIDGAFEAEHFFPKMGGGGRWLYFTAAPLRDDDGRLTGAIETLQDITDRKRAEEQLREAKEVAEQATSAKSSFLATMSHEIRTPMNGVIGMLDLLDNSLLNSAQHEMIDVIRDSAETLLAIINDILDLSKIEAGRMEIEKIPLSLKDTVETAVDLIAGRAEERRLDLAWWVEPSLPDRLLGDPVRLRQLLFNLVGNAVKFTEKGSVTVTVTAVPGPADRASMRFAVTDTGIGLTKEQMTRLFQPFSQANVSTTRRYGGTGLGLSICRRLVELMQGRVGASSEEGKGSTFWFELDLPISPEDKPAISAPALNGLDILIADSDFVGRRLIADCLKAEGATVSEAEDAGRLLALLDRKAAFDVAVIDHHLLDQISAPTIARHMPLDNLLVVGLKSKGLAEEIRNAGAALFGKPVRRSALVRAVLAQSGQAPGGWKTAVRQVQPSSLPFPAGTLVLAAEDNPTNRLVLSRQLSGLGIPFEIVEDGEQAWAALKEKRYSLLLTDCRMPNLDGFGLSRMIRAREAEQGGPRLPIVALTANALSGDANDCFHAGMDDYLSKPVTLKRLKETLAKWIEAEAPAAEEAPAGNVPADGAVDLAALADILGSDDPAELKEIVAFFVESFVTLLDELNRALKAEDRAGLQNAAHAAKGAARNVCAPRLALIMEQLEKRATSAALEELAVLLAEGEAAYQLVCRFQL